MGFSSRQHLITGAAAAVLATTSFGAAARAQDAPRRPAPSTELTEVLVTAEKRVERLQDIAAAVSVLSASELERTGASNIRDFATSLPSVTIVPIENSTTKIVIRGVSTGNNYEATTTATGLYLDDVPMASSYGSGGAELTTTDLKRVEVLRGPQGTLYGAGSEGGTVKYLTNEPNAAALEGSVAVSGSRTAGSGEYGIEGVLNLPLVQDRFAVRLVAYHRDADGYIDNVRTGEQEVNFAEITGGRASARWTPTDRLTVSLLGAYQRSDLGTSNWVDMTSSLVPLAGDLKQSLSVVPEPARVRSKLGSFRIDYDLGWATFTSATSLTNFRRAETIDDTFFLLGSLTRAFVPGTRSLSEVFSTQDKGLYEEIRLASPAEDSRFKWVLGLFYRDYKLDARRPLAPDPFPGFFALDLIANQKFRDIAGFGQASYDLTDQLEVTLGGRLTHATNYYGQTLTGLFINPRSPTTPIVSPSERSSETHFSPKAEITYRPAEGKLFYALVSEGFRAGGPNTSYPAPIPAVPETYLRDSVWNYEVGAKTAWLNGRLVVNAALFDLEIKRLQLVTTIPGFGLPYIANAGKARSKGVELEVRANLATGLQLSGNATYDDATFLDPAPALRVTTPGTRIPQVPKWTYTGAVDYSRSLGGGVEGYAHLDFRHVGDTVSLLVNGTAPAVVLPSYEILNARVGLVHGDTSLAVFLENLTNERAKLQAIRVDGTTPAGLRVVIARPRTIGVKLAQQF
jgi:iron complex outermembrane recepter protein